MGRPSLVLGHGRVQGSRFQPGEAVRLLIGSEEIGVKADETGAFSLPHEAPVGRVVQAFGSSGSRADTGIGITRIGVDD